MQTQLLDCTLRDGCHVNGGNFGEKHIINVINNLTAANLDIVEIGFLKQCEYSPDYAYYPRIEDAYDLLTQTVEPSHTEFALMARADAYDISNLSECDGKINFIRVAFYYDFLNGAIKIAREVQSRGYRLALNLITTPSCSQSELREVIRHVNVIKPYVLTLVDTFGVLHQKELESILDLYDAELNPDIRIGLHPHENMSLSFSLAQYFAERFKGGRSTIIDSSLMGMGRIPGNLCTEMVADYLNNEHCKSYDLVKILNSIEDDITSIRQTLPWGYSPAYFLSARHRVHRSYSEYLLNQSFRLDQIETLLSKISPEHFVKFDKEYINSIIKEMFGQAASWGEQ